MSVLVDSNVLLRRVETTHPQHAIAVQAVSQILRSTEPAYVTLQNLTEAWRVMTDPPTRNGLGLTIAFAAGEISRIEKAFTLLSDDTPAISAEWQRLVVQHQVVGLQAFDARLAATMLVHNIDRILTFDAGFTRYGVPVLDPAAAP